MLYHVFGQSFNCISAGCITSLTQTPGGVAAGGPVAGMITAGGVSDVLVVVVSRFWRGFCLLIVVSCVVLPLTDGSMVIGAVLNTGSVC